MSRTTEILVLHADSDHVKLVRARSSGGRVELLNPGVFRLHDKGKDAHALDDKDIRDSLATHVARHGWRGRNLFCLLGGSSVACYYYDLPRLNEQELRQAVHLKLKQQLHFDVAEAVVAVDVVNGAATSKTDTQRVRGAAIQRDRITSLMAAAAHSGLNVADISAAPAALAVLAQDYLKTEKGLTAALYVDENASTLVVLNDGAPCVTTEMSIGLSGLTAGLMRPIIDGERVIQLDEAQAVAIRNGVGIPVAGQIIEALGVDGQRLLPLIEPALQKFAKQLIQWLTFAATTVDKGKIETVRLVGPGAAIPNLGPALGARLSRDVRAEQWLHDTVLLPHEGPPHLLDCCAAAVGAVRYAHTLPDMLPPEMRLRRRLSRIRKSVSLCGVIAAAASLAFAVLFDQIHARLLPSVELQRRQLPEVQDLVGQNGRWEREQAATRRMEAEFEAFSAGSPLWVGLFKEVAGLLPFEVRAKELSAREVDGGIKLTLNGEVLARKDGGAFDEVVEKTLLRLQRSTFVKRVQLLGANRETEENQEAAGILSVEMDLIHPRGKKRT